MKLMRIVEIVEWVEIGGMSDKYMHELFCTASVCRTLS